MRASYIQLREKSLIYKGEIYENIDLLKDIRFAKKMIIVILDESLYINKVDIRENKSSNEKIVCGVIKESFGNGDDFLFNYDVARDKQTLYIYGVKGGLKVAKLCKDARNIKVIPVQILVVNILKKGIKENAWQCIFKFMNVFYFCYIKDGILEFAFAQDNIKLFEYKLGELLNEEVLYLDNTINGLNINGIDKINYIELGRILNEKIFCK